MLNPLLFSIALGAAAPAPCPADTACVIRETEGYTFRFTYPMAAARIAGLDGMLRERATEAEAALAQAAAAGDQSGRLHFDASYRLDAELPEIVALTGTTDAWNGQRVETIMFDPRSHERLDLVSLFAPETFDNAFFWSRPRGIRAAQDSFCHAFTEAVRARRAALQLRELDAACPDVERQQIAPICNGRGRILAMRAYVRPEDSLAADPDAPRSYRVDFAMTAEMIGVMKQRYRVAFGLPGETRGRRRRRCPSG